MHNAQASRSTLEQALAPHGLRVRGGLIPHPSDGLPELPAGVGTAVIWMVGQVGSECWNAFSSSPFYRDGLPDPMDRWSKSIGNTLASRLGGRALYPSDGPPYFPFQQWARRAGPAQISPLMLQIHPEHGLWHAYRFCLALPELLPEDARDIAGESALSDADICLNCDGQPCLSACPVDAFTGTSFEVDRCAEYLHGAEGQRCMQTGCQARQACPVGTPFQYIPRHAAFHMAAFSKRH
jgi:ferredoxin